MATTFFIIVISISLFLWSQSNENNKKIRNFSLFAYLIIDAISILLMLKKVMTPAALLFVIFSPMYAAIVLAIYKGLKSLIVPRRRRFRKDKKVPSKLSSLEIQVNIISKKLDKTENHFAALKTQVQPDKIQLQNIEDKIKKLFAQCIDILPQIEEGIRRHTAYIKTYVQLKHKIEQSTEKLQKLGNEIANLSQNIKPQIVKNPPKTRKKHHQKQFDKLSRKQKNKTQQLWKKGEAHLLWKKFDVHNQDDFWQQYEALLALTKTTYGANYVSNRNK